MQGHRQANAEAEEIETKNRRITQQEIVGKTRSAPAPRTSAVRKKEVTTATPHAQQLVKDATKRNFVIQVVLQAVERLNADAEAEKVELEIHSQSQGEGDLLADG